VKEDEEERYYIPRKEQFGVQQHTEKENKGATMNNIHKREKPHQ